jgi:hypothetical protein
MQQYLQDFFKKFGGRYKRIRRRPKGVPMAEHYTLQVEKLKELEAMSTEEKIDLFMVMRAMYAAKAMFLTAGSFRMKTCVFFPKKHISSTFSDLLTGSASVGGWLRKEI